MRIVLSLFKTNMSSFSMSKKGFVIAERLVAAFGVTHLDSLVFFLFSFDNAYINSRIKLSQVLSDDVHNLSTFEETASSFVKHVSSVMKMSRITKICHDCSRFPRCKEWIKHNLTDTSISLYGIDMVEIMTIISLLENFWNLHDDIPMSLLGGAFEGSTSIRVDGELEFGLTSTSFAFLAIS